MALSGMKREASNVSAATTALKLVPITPQKAVNPFKIPPENEIFQLRDAERQKKKSDRENQRSLAVHEKTTYAHQMRARTLKARQPFGDTEIGAELVEGEGDQVIGQDDPLQLATRDRHVEKEDLASFVAKKREMFLVQYSLGVKRDEMRKLEEIAQAEELKLEKAEQFLEEDANMFDAFLKETDKNSVEAIKLAEQETKAKMEKVAEIKKIQAQITGLRSEISKNEDQLKEYQTYKIFLENLTPVEWKGDREKRRAGRRAERKKKKAEEKPVPTTPSSTSQSQDRGSKRGSVSRTPNKAPRRKASNHGADTESLVSGVSNHYESDGEESDDSCDLYFNDPQQLLNIFAELEEQNLSLIQNSQETEEALDEMKQTIETTKARMNKETEVLKAQIGSLETQITAEEEKSKELEHKSKMFSYGHYEGDNQEKILEMLNEKVEEVYRRCIGDNEANISTLQMLTNIENRLEELFEHIEMMPQEKVELAEKAKEKERRLKLREEKKQQQKLHQEERVRKALERAKADPKVQTGKRLVFRSKPPEEQKKQTDVVDKSNAEDEELAYYFS